MPPRSGPPAFHPLEPRRLLTASNFYIASWNADPELREYTQAGTLVRRIPLPQNVVPDDPRDFIVDAQNRIHIFNGSYPNPVLTTRTGSTFTHHTFPGWTAGGALTDGGIAAYKQFVFVSDQNTGNGAEEGIVRFDTTNNFAATRFADTTQPSDLNMGLDGLLYALEDSGPPRVRVYDPDSLALLRTVTLPWEDLRSVAADRQGNIYAGEYGKRLHKLDPQGKEIKTITQPHSTVDLDFAADGTLMIRIYGEVKLYDTDLNLLKAIPVPAEASNFVAWVQPQAVPEAPKPATVSGQVLADNNASARRDAGDAPLANWRVYVDADKDGAFDAGEPAALTDSAGNYTIPDVPPGTWRLRAQLKPGFRQTAPSRKSFLVVTVAGKSIAGQTFLATDRSRLTGVVFVDKDRDAARDAGELGRAQARVFLDLNDNGVFDKKEPSALTDADGNYAFPAVKKGAYTLRLAPVPRMSQTGPKGGRYALTFSTAQIVTGVNFGLRRRP